MMSKKCRKEVFAEANRNGEMQLNMKKFFQRIANKITYSIL